MYGKFRTAWRKLRVFNIKNLILFGQVLDGLYHRLNVWRYTAEYLETGLVREPYEVTECSSSSEAEEIADCYQEIIRTIEEQI